MSEHNNQYVMFLAEKTLPGLNIMEPEAYVRLISASPGFQHDNWGDFYSQIHVEDLPKTIYDALDKENPFAKIDSKLLGKKLNTDIEIVRSSDFKTIKANVTKDYLIQEPHGVRIYSPEMHKPHNAINRTTGYGIFMLLFAEALLNSHPEGSLEAEINKFGSDMESLIRKFSLK